MRAQSVSSADGATAWHSAIAACRPYAARPRPIRSALARAARPAFDLRAVPAGAILLVERDRRAVAGDPRSESRRVELHERDERLRLGLARHQARDHARESQGLGRDIRPHPLLARGGQVALVEDQVEHAQHGSEPLGVVLRLGDLERHVRRGEGLLGAHDALLDRRDGHEERPGDLLAS